MCVHSCTHTHTHANKKSNIDKQLSSILEGPFIQQYYKV